MFILRKKYQRGEIATLLTLISVGLMLAGIIAGTKLAKSPQTTKSNAAYPTGNLDGTVDNGSENPPAKCTDGSWTCGDVTANPASRQNLNQIIVRLLFTTPRPRTKAVKGPRFLLSTRFRNVRFLTI